MRRGYAALAPHCVVHERTIANEPQVRVTGSARLKQATPHLLCFGADATFRAAPP